MQWQRERLLFGCWLGREWTLSRGIDSKPDVGWGDLKLLPTWWNKNKSLFSLNTNCTFYMVKKYKKKMQWENERLLLGCGLGRQWTISWRILRLLLAGETFYSFLLDGISIIFFSGTKYINWLWKPCPSELRHFCISRINSIF